MQQQRRTNPYPFTWEIPVLTLLGVLLAAALGVHTGRGLATLAAGHGWTWPEHARLFSSLPAVWAGDPHAGLTAGALPASVSVPLTAAIIGAELVILLALGVVGKWLLGRWGPHRMRGMATASQAAAVLGVGRLRHVRHLIRPDLYPRRSLR